MAPILYPEPSAIATVADMRYADLRAIHDRLEHRRSPWAQVLATAGTTLLGCVLGGLFGLIAFLSATPAPGQLEQVCYIGGLAFAFALGAICLLVGFLLRKQHAESISEIAEDLGRLLDPYSPDEGESRSG